MTDGNPLAAPTLPEIERALDEVVSALVAYRLSPPDAVRRAMAGKSSEILAIPIEDLMATDRAVLGARDIARSPVEDGLKYAIKKLGKLVHAAVGDGGMLNVAERVCGLDADNWGRRMSPIDSAWDGIGSWHS
jgi:hypothetical protein